MKKYSLITLLLSCVVALGAQATLPPPFPRTNATKLLETDRITVWDIVWPTGQPTAMHRHVYDQVGTYYASGGRLITTPDGTARAVVTEVGSLSTTRKGTTHIEEGNTDPPLRAVFIELKRETASGLPAADIGGAAPFPREGAKQILDDDRVTAWDYMWASSPQRLRYRPARETVIVWLGTGRVSVTQGDGVSATVGDVAAGTMHHMTAGSNQTVEIIRGSPRAIIFQLK
jgi:quercetin dioxygenase-like cupin family protein